MWIYETIKYNHHKDEITIHLNNILFKVICKFYQQ